MNMRTSKQARQIGTGGQWKAAPGKWTQINADSFRINRVSCWAQWAGTSISWEDEAIIGLPTCEVTIKNAERHQATDFDSHGLLRATMFEQHQTQANNLIAIRY